MTTPGLAPALALACGTAFAARFPPAAGAEGWLLPATALLAGLGWGWRRAAGVVVAWAAAGALLLWARPELRADCLSQLDAGRPVAMVGDLTRDWRASDFGTGWESNISVRRARQGTKVVRCRATVALTAAGPGRPATGSGLRVRGFLRRSDTARNGTARHPSDPARGGRFRMHLKSSRFLTGPSNEPGSAGFDSRLGELGRGLRGWVEEGLGAVRFRPGVEAARALALGDRDALDPGLVRALRRSGLAHLFAVSGLHVALVSLLVHWVLRGLGHRLRWGLTTLVVLAYLILVGARPSIIRAAAMSFMAFGAFWSARPAHARQALCVVAGALLAFDPALISSLGLQLTVAATAGILWLSPALEKSWSALPRALRRSLAATVGAQLASLPWTASAFSQVHPLAPILNLVAIPWMAAFAACSFLACGVMRLAPATREIAAAVLDFGISPARWLERAPAGPWLTFPVALGFWEAALLAGGLLVLLLARGALPRALAMVLAIALLRGPSISDFGEVVAIDVGQGDAILLHDGEQAALVDGGGWRGGDIGASVLVPTLARLGVRRLATAVVTHADTDHCRGLLDLSYYVPIDRILSAPGAATSSCVRSLVTRPGVRWRELWSGQTARVGRVRFEVLHPAPESPNRGNDSSLVLRATLGSRSILLSGDVEAASERAIVARHSPDRLRSVLLKLAHHGSKTSTSARFLDAVAPRIAIVSAGRRNHYGHPAPVVLSRCRERGLAVVRTDRDGMVRLPFEPRGSPRAATAVLDSGDG